MRILYFQSTQSLLPFSDACLCLTPKIFLPNPHQLYLDLFPTLKALGGEAKALLQFEKLCVSFHQSGKFILVDKPEWARAFYQYFPEKNDPLPPGKSFPQLLKFPIEALAFCGDPLTLEKEQTERKKLTAFMRRVGMTSLGDFALLEPTAIGRRFGKMGIVLHQWVLGQRPLKMALFEPAELIKETLDAEEICSLSALVPCLNDLLKKIELRLGGRGLKAKELKLRFFVESGNHQGHSLKLSEPLSEAGALLKFVQEYLNNKKWDSPLRSLEIEVLDAVSWVPGQLSLFDQTENKMSDLENYVGRLRSRFGEHSVGFAALKESYLPERSWKRVWPPPAASNAGLLPHYLPKKAQRPLFLYHPPRPYPPPSTWKLTLCENLATEWWEQGGFRRYYVANTPQGDRFWLFWDCERCQWFLQGTFD